MSCGHTPTEVEQYISGHGVVAAHAVVEVDACARSIESDVAVEQRVERLSLEEETVLLGVNAELVRHVHNDASASGLVAAARVEAHACYGATVGEAPLSDSVSRHRYWLHCTAVKRHLCYGSLTNFYKLVADDERISIEAEGAS